MIKSFFILIFLGFASAIWAQQFEDIAEDLGLDHVYQLCDKAAGLAFTDFDGDGLDDLLLPSCAGSPIRIYKNTGGAFEEYENPAIQAETGDAKCILAADYDNDGDRDILITNISGPNRLFRNDGDNTYEEIGLEIGMLDNDYDSYSASFADIDKDGDLDLYIGNRTPTNEYQPNPLYLNNGDGTFTDISAEAGVQDPYGAALAVGFVDINNDTWPDLYVANDKLTGNKLYLNNGDLTFTDISASSGTDYEMDGMSVSLTDADGNGYQDFYVTNTPAGNAFFLNNGDLTFTDVAEDEGLLINKGTWGAIFFDADNDGGRDLYIPAMGPGIDLSNEFFLKDSNGWTTAQDWFPPDFYHGMGAATGDFNADGKLDLVVLNKDENLYFFENQVEDAGNWVEVTPIGNLSGTEAVGSWIEVTCGLDVFRVYTTLGSNFASQNSRRIHIGIGNYDSIDHIKVIFPNGMEATMEIPEINTHHEILEPILTGGIPEPEWTLDLQPQDDMGSFWTATIPTSSEYTMKVMDMQGRLVTTQAGQGPEVQLWLPYLVAGNYNVVLEFGGFRKVGGVWRR